MLASSGIVARTFDATGHLAMWLAVLKHLLIWFVFMVAIAMSLVENPAWGLVWSLLVVGAVLFQFVVGGPHRGSSRAIPLEGIGRVSALTMVGGITVGFVFLYFAQTAYQILPLQPFMSTAEIDEFITRPGGIVTYAVAFGVGMVLITEFCFRWWIPRTCGEVFGGHQSVILSSAIFGLVAGMVIWAPITFLYGLVLGYAAFIAGSVWASIILMWGHIICWWALGEFFPERDVTLLWTDFAGSSVVPPLVAAIGSGCLLVVIGVNAWRQAFPRP